MNPKIKSVIQNIAGVTISLIMFGSILGYFYTLLVGLPNYISNRFVLAALVINTLGIVVIANLATVNKSIRNILNFFLGILLSIFLIIGFFKGSVNTINELVFSLAFSVLTGFILMLYFNAENQIKKTIAYFLVVIFSIFTIASFFNITSTNINIYNYLIIFSLVGFFGLLLLLDGTKNLIRKYLNADFSSEISYTSLVLITALLGFFVYIVFVVSSFGGISGFIGQNSGSGGSSVDTSMAIYQLIYFVVLALLGVGWLTRRKFIDILKRLGMVLPTGKQILIALLLTGLLYSVDFILGLIGTKLHLINPSQDVSNNQALYGGILNITGVIILALSAGIGEEILFRGALQPKFGIIVTTLLFAAAHGQYNLWGMITVLIMGFVLAYERKKMNTTSSMITHAAFDFVGLMLIVLAK
jgi:hypothetical protein